MSDTMHSAIGRYAAGEISAMQAATELGEPTNVGDVIAIAGLRPPDPPMEQQRAELAHARRVLGLDRVAMGPERGYRDAGAGDAGVAYRI